MRENKLSPNYSMQSQSDLPPKRVRDYIGKYEPRQRAANEAGPRNTDLMKRPPYKVGDGDTPLVLRPGAMDYKKYPSNLWEGGEQ